AREHLELSKLDPKLVISLSKASVEPIEDIIKMWEGLVERELSGDVSLLEHLKAVCSRANAEGAVLSNNCRQIIMDAATDGATSQQDRLELLHQDVAADLLMRQGLPLNLEFWVSLGQDHPNPRSSSSDDVQATVDAMSGGKTGGNLNWKGIADMTSLGHTYLYYKFLSDDSSHYSASSLNRHLINEKSTKAWSGYSFGPGSKEEIS
nr:hypothetical protein [Tanacetum cinerariifolium]